MSENPEVALALLKQEVAHLKAEVEGIRTNIRWATLSVIGVVVAGVTKLFGF